VRGILLAFALLVSGCGDSSSLGIADPSSGLATDEPLATEDMASEAPGTELPAPAALPVKVTKRAGSVARGSFATVGIKTAKKARCDIDVEYDSGTGTAKGLATKTADSGGRVTWRWRVGRNTHKGSVPITVSCTLGNRSGSVDTTFTVR
jgi:hypothetical protein